jgi:hypothetical protein
MHGPVGKPAGTSLSPVKDLEAGTKSGPVRRDRQFRPWLTTPPPRPSKVCRSREHHLEECHVRFSAGP